MAANSTTILSNAAKFMALTYRQRLAIIAYTLACACDTNLGPATYTTNLKRFVSDASTATKGLNRNEALFEASLAYLVVAAINQGFGANSYQFATDIPTVLTKINYLQTLPEDTLKRCILFGLGSVGNV